MDCARYREALSARMDGEHTALESAALDGHLAGCPACRAWAEAASRVTRAARVAPAAEVPDLTGSILAAVAAQTERRPGPKPRAAPVPASPLSVARFGLLVVGLWVLAYPAASARRHGGRTRPA